MRQGSTGLCATLRLPIELAANNTDCDSHLPIPSLGTCDIDIAIAFTLKTTTDTPVYTADFTPVDNTNTHSLSLSDSLVETYTTRRRP